jgi:serine phosphatase RsbU (regulator of sigma subunit)
MRKYKGLQNKIAAFSPCVAKSLEFDMTGNVDYNVTIKNLCIYIEKNNITLPMESTSFDSMEPGLGGLFPTPGGLYENIEFYIGKTKRIDRAEGLKLYKSLDEYAMQPIEKLPIVYDVLNCIDGCNDGTGCNHDRDIFTINTEMQNIRKSNLSNEDRRNRLNDIFTDFNKRLQFADFLTTYTPSPIPSISVSDKQIEDAFISINKFDKESRHYDCGACGHDRCMEMALQIAKGVNIPQNCIYFVKSQITKVAEDALNEVKYSLKLQNSLGRITNSSVFTNGVMIESANLIVREGCLALNASRASVWLISTTSDIFQNIASFDASTNDYFNQADNDFFHQDAYLNTLKTERVFVIFSTSQFQIFGIETGSESPNLCAMLTAPIRINGNLIGMVSIEQDKTDIYQSERDWKIIEQDFVSTLADFMTIVFASAEREKTKDELGAAHEIIVSSINYAAKIQGNLLPKEKVFIDAFSDYSVIWKPRDIVGGDIYWAKSFDTGTVLCVGDCTGHGIPGALLTVLLVDSLESIVSNDNCSDTANIVFKLDQRFASVLNVRSSNVSMEVNDGCDLAIMFIATDGSVTMSAGKISVFICDGKEVIRHKGQAISVGEGRLTGPDDVKFVKIPANPSNKYFVASDGLSDQIGGNSGKQFGYKQLEQIILKNHSETLGHTSFKIWDAFEEHRGQNQRRDDFVLVSFKP